MPSVIKIIIWRIVIVAVVVVVTVAVVVVVDVIIVVVFVADVKSGTVGFEEKGLQKEKFDYN